MAAGGVPAQAGDLVGQTTEIMQAIAEQLTREGLSFAQVCKATTHYLGSSEAQDLHANMAVRNGDFQRPGPASTGVPVAGFPWAPDARIAISFLGIG